MGFMSLEQGVRGAPLSAPRQAKRATSGKIGLLPAPLLGSQVFQRRMLHEAEKPIFGLFPVVYGAIGLAVEAIDFESDPTRRLSTSTKCGKDGLQDEAGLTEIIVPVENFGQ
jgi:hypothetical protein